jgi:hypothetical protein
MYAVTAHPLHPAGFSPMTSPYMSIFVSFIFFFFIFFLSDIRPPVVVAFGHPLPFMFFFYSLARAILAHFQYDVLYKF